MPEIGAKPATGTAIMGVNPANGAAAFVAVSAAGAMAVSSESTAIGAVSDAAWNGTDANASVISLLKAIAINTKPATP